MTREEAVRVKRMLGLVILALLAGCGLIPSSETPPDDRVNMSPSGLVGTWSNIGRGSAITFYGNGAFAAIGLPYEVFSGFTRVLPDDFDKDRDVITASGTWKLGASREDPDGPHNYVSLHTDEVMGRPDSGGIGLYAEKDGSGTVVLTFYIGDPDLNDRVVYEKCAANCPTVTPNPTTTPTPPG